ncbi:unnamed protein product [Oikopleura dioica]|uniref:Uncharacterized protein n=1 Tax=Oikopleura dioica TaxID=34765 RepID=E4Y244_OIKDI|nr:unnamed protein product [Oikopleura dioica]
MMARNKNQHVKDPFLQYLVGGVKTCRKIMTGEEEEQSRVIKWRKHESIQRMDTAIPNTFKRSNKYDNFVQNTTGYDVDHQCKTVQSNVLDYIQNETGAKDQEELPIIDSLSKLVTSGYRQKAFSGSKALLEQINGKSEPNSTDSLLSQVSEELKALE